jgi:hypothetical protein
MSAGASRMVGPRPPPAAARVAILDPPEPRPAAKASAL